MPLNKKFYYSTFLAVSSSLILASCGDSDNSSPANTAPKIEHLGGGDTTVNARGSDAFSHASRNMSNTSRITGFNEGNHFFENPWVAFKQSTQARDGLGPYFNSDACQGCHINDGRGHADMTAAGDEFNSMLIRVSTSNASPTAQQANVGDASVGGQLQHKSVTNVNTEATQTVSYTPETITFNDGFEVELLTPIWSLTNNIGTFDPSIVFSARVAPPMIGLGLLELIDEADINAKEDIDDADNDGISGKANKVYSLEFAETKLGRFGWKAGQPSLLEQTSGAFLGDMGLTSKFHTTENCTTETDCLNSENGNGTNSNPIADYEVTDSVLALVTFYSNHLAVPERRNAYSEQVQQGKALFIDAGCSACHTESYTTSSHEDQPELSNQIIFPYTDMLLHDMGPELADFDINGNAVSADVAVEFLATATEWRTPPLWGLGLTHTVDAKATFLHDGRARTIMEAVLWHGGEAQNAKENVLQFNANERAALLAFLNDL